MAAEETEILELRARLEALEGAKVKRDHHGFPPAEIITAMVAPAPLLPTRDSPAGQWMEKNDKRKAAQLAEAEIREARLRREREEAEAEAQRQRDFAAQALPGAIDDLTKRRDDLEQFETAHRNVLVERDLLAGEVLRAQDRIRDLKKGSAE